MIIVNHNGSYFVSHSNDERCVKKVLQANDNIARAESGKKIVSQPRKGLSRRLRYWHNVRWHWLRKMSQETFNHIFNT